MQWCVLVETILRISVHLTLMAVIQTERTIDNRRSDSLVSHNMPFDDKPLMIRISDALMTD